ncbi:MAG: DNA repair protein RecO [Candidatus Kapaibacteriota bacterium]|jgi:DNA repair protein RecO (recombination protein O)
MNINTNEGIILSAIKYSDSSKILRVFTKEMGKISFIAKGAFSKNNKFGASIEASTIGSFTYYFKNNREIQLLSESSFAYKFRNIYNDIYRIATTYIILEVLDFTLSKEQINEQAYEMAKEYLIKNDNIEINTYLNLIEFLLKYTELMGFKFNFDRINYEVKSFNLKNEINKNKNNNINNTHQKITVSLEDLTPVKNNYDFIVKSIKLNIETLSFIQILEEVIENIMSEDGSQSIQTLQNAEKYLDLEKQLDNILFHDLINFFVEYYSYHFDKKMSLKSLKLLNY